MCSFSNWFEKKLSRLLDPNSAMTNRILLLRMESAFPKWEMKHHIPTRIPCRSFAITLHFPLTECENKQPVLLFFWFVCFVSFFSSLVISMECQSMQISVYLNSHKKYSLSASVPIPLTKQQSAMRVMDRKMWQKLEIISWKSMDDFFNTMEKFTWNCH